MRSQLGAAVRKQFDRALRERLPWFQPHPIKYPQGSRAYRWELRPGFWCFLLLYISDRNDNFTIECAWSHAQDFPKCRLKMPRDIPESGITHGEPEGGEFCFRMSYLWTSKDEWWWLVPEQEVRRRFEEFTDATIAKDTARALRLTEDPPLEPAMANVRPMVEEVVQRIVDYAIPYFTHAAHSQE